MRMRRLVAFLAFCGLIAPGLIQGAGSCRSAGPAPCRMHLTAEACAAACGVKLHDEEAAPTPSCHAVAAAPSSSCRMSVPCSHSDELLPVAASRPATLPDEFCLEPPDAALEWGLTVARAPDRSQEVRKLPPRC